MSTCAIDTHAHVFSAGRPMAAGRRYSPDYDAPLSAFLDVLDRHGIARGVLVQPSFYGTDNSYMLECLAAEPVRLRGVAVLAPETTDKDLEALDRAGVVGVRFNLIGTGPALLKDAAQRQLLRRVQALGWHVEVQAEGADWPCALRALEDYDGPIVADHFGRPDPEKGTACAGFQAILSEGSDGRLYVKLSAPYRCGGADVQRYADALMQRLGPNRLLWGSDWPWTQFEAGRDYGALAATAASGTPPFSQLLAPAAARLFRFAEIG
ncbi:amidohydrolase family protein [Pseudorhodoplanes sinuspersici]|nr:amidohydrolase family protein [Pseudorhodoplanes sinuspersici]